MNISHQHGKDIYQLLEETWRTYLKKDILPSLLLIMSDSHNTNSRRGKYAHLFKTVLSRYQQTMIMSEYLSTHMFRYMDKYYIHYHNLRPISDFGSYLFFQEIWIPLLSHLHSGFSQYVEERRHDCLQNSPLSTDSSLDIFMETETVEAVLLLYRNLNNHQFEMIAFCIF